MFVDINCAQELANALSNVLGFYVRLLHGIANRHRLYPFRSRFV